MAAKVLLSSTSATLPSGSGPCVAIVDLSPKAGDFARARLKMPMASVRMRYIALGPDSHLEWAKSDLRDIATERFLGRTLTIHTFAQVEPWNGRWCELETATKSTWQVVFELFQALIEEIDQVIPEKCLRDV